MSQGGMNTPPQTNPMVSGASINRGSFTNAAPGMMGGMGGPASPSYAPQPAIAVDQPAQPQGSPVSSIDTMQPFSQQSIPMQLQQMVHDNRFGHGALGSAIHGGKGGMAGQPMPQQPWMKTPMQQQVSPQQQGLAALMNSQQQSQSSTNSLR